MQRQIKHITMPNGIIAGTLRRGGKTYTRNPHSKVNNPNTHAQQHCRSAFRQNQQMYSQMKHLLRGNFEDTERLSAYLQFMSVNQQFADTEGLPEVWISQGSLHPLGYELKDGRLVTDIKLGGLEIDESTSVGELAREITERNRRFREGDELVVMRVWGDGYLEDRNQYRISASESRLRLDRQSERKVVSISDCDFRTYQGRLATAEIPELKANDSLALAVYQMRRKKEKRRVSSQRLLSVINN